MTTVNVVCTWRLYFLSCSYQLLFLVVAFLHVSSGLKIRRLVGPSWVENGTTDGVVLDCEYEYNENDLKLVVKWFFNDDLEPVYQWIPQLNLRHTSGVLHGRLDMEYSASPKDPYSQYRALRIINPTPELSGNYTCHIISLGGLDSRKHEMTVYAPAKSFHFDYTLPHEYVVNFTCTAKDVYPEPRMKIFYLPEGKPRRVFEGENKSFVKRNNNSFDITYWTTPNSRELPDDRVTVVECFLEVFGSPFRKSNRITYVPGVQGLDGYFNAAKRSTEFNLATLPILIVVQFMSRLLNLT